MYLYADISNLTHAAANSSSVGGGNQPPNASQVALAVIQQVAQIARSYRATRIYWFLDPAPEHGSWRKKIFPEYKAQRPENLAKDPARLLANEVANKALHGDIPELIEITACPAFRFPYLEADDLCAAATALNATVPGIIVTADKDYWQLLRPGLQILNPIHSYRVELDENGIILKRKGDGTVESIGLTPAQFLLAKAIQGDTSDNIPGLIGIGEITATKAVAEGRVPLLLTEQTGMITPRKSKNNPNPVAVQQDARLVVAKNLTLVDLLHSQVFPRAMEVVAKMQADGIREQRTNYTRLVLWLEQKVAFSNEQARTVATQMAQTFTGLWTA